METENNVPNTPKEKTYSKLAVKICRIMGEIDNLEKKGYNESQKYAFLRESDVAEAIRKALATHNVAIFPSVLEVVREPYTYESYNGPKTTNFTSIKLKYLIIDGDSEESITLIGAGSGVDSQEKGLYKAITGAHKYFLQKLFNIGADNDPENEPAEKGTSNTDTAPIQQFLPNRPAQSAPPQEGKTYRKVDVTKYAYAYDISNAEGNFKPFMQKLKDAKAIYSGKENDSWWVINHPVAGLEGCLVKSPETQQKAQDYQDDDIPF